MDYITIDFEASCLPRHGLSFPIEVGIADDSGARSWLIQPAAGWTGWDWTTEAAAIHGITLGDLHRNGLPAHRVFAELNRAIAGRDLVADSKLDAYWWRLLAGAAGEDLHAPIRHIAAVLDELDCPSAAVFAAQHYADGLAPLATVRRTMRCGYGHCSPSCGEVRAGLGSTIAARWFPDTPGRSSTCPAISPPEL